MKLIARIYQQQRAENARLRELLMAAVEEIEFREEHGESLSKLRTEMANALGESNAGT